MLGYFYIAGCIIFTVYGQLIIKWRMSGMGELPENTTDKITFLVSSLFSDAFLMSGFGAAFAASLFWMAAMTKFELSFAYPFMSLAFVLVLVLGVLLLDETLTPGKAIGVSLICIGVIISTSLA